MPHRAPLERAVVHACDAHQRRHVDVDRRRRSALAACPLAGGRRDEPAWPARRLGAMPLTCAACGPANLETTKFCGECGARLVIGQADRPESRSLVTVLFADVAGSTAFGAARSAPFPRLVH